MRAKKDRENALRNQKKSPKMEQNKDCPLCLEVLEMDDVNFFPCKCGYQICRFCWHRIRTNENGLCPACRRQYTEDPANFKPLSVEELQKLKSQKRLKDQQRKQKLAEDRKQLANVRVVQRNLVFVIGLPLGLGSDEVKLQRITHLFKQMGPVQKVIVNDRTKYAGSQGPSACAYITYNKAEDALKAVKTLASTEVEGKIIKVSLGTTKYCSNFLKNTHCPKQDCMYLHEIAEEEASYTKEEIHSGKHSEYEQKLFSQMVNGANYHKVHSSSESIECNESKHKVDNSSVRNLEEIQHKEFTCDSSDGSSLDSPVQSDTRNSVAIVNGDRFSPIQNSSSSKLECSRNISPSDLQLKRTLLTENSLLNGMHCDSNNFENFPHISQTVCNGDQLKENELEIPRQSRLLSKRLYQKSPSHTPVLPERDNNTIFNMMSASQPEPEQLYPFSSNSISHDCLDEDDCGLGFDPCDESLKGLQELLISEKEEKAVLRRKLKTNPFRQSVRHSNVAVQTPESVRFRPVINQQQRETATRDPPPGFPMNGFMSPNQPFSSPVFENGNAVSSRTTTIMDLHSQLNAGRPNIISRFQQPTVTLSNNSNPFWTEYSQQPSRTYSPREVYDLMSVSTPKIQNFSHPQFSSIEPYASTSFWNNTSQSHWRPCESTVYNQSLFENQEPSPVARQQQLRANELSRRQLQQQQQHLNNLKYNSYSPYTDLSYLFSNKIQNRAANKDLWSSLGLKFAEML